MILQIEVDVYCFSSFLGLVLYFFWNVIFATTTYIKGERQKPGSNENYFNKTYPIQEASYWGIGSSTSITEIVGNILRELKINHYSFEHYKIVRKSEKCLYTCLW